MALFGLFGSTHDMTTGTYAGRESASDRAARKDAEARSRRAASHRKAATKLDRQVNAEIDANRTAERSGTRGRGWW
ncbi:hypothetical protein GXW83_27375 [Streptacidiphilus sp. PB12-B1b]|uniref:hypothetical protein n=1 Tax=Streptacidiphilus sp. PB12-B1b TaxID=2705012 RepID=UPI0015F7982F|nr:hypothetical protein [Streptacidiphilus sp. PB12-B1b]QMU78868.1 hypothetical protein GXW83_27375 [Streptacidiphilus sp. PB12-B1b]